MDHLPASQARVAEHNDDTRHKLAASIKQSAQTAIADPDAEHTSRMMILGHFLDPAADVVDKAITRYERGQRFPTIDREKIADYIARAMERKVLGMGHAPMPLTELLQPQSPFAWSDRFASACVQSGITEVRRARTRETSIDFHTADTDHVFASVVGTHGVELRTISAEELYLLRERRELIVNVEEIVDTWGEQDLTRFERDAARVLAVRTLLGVPKAAVNDLEHRRWLAAFLTTDGAHAQVMHSLVAHRDLAGGDPKWEQLDVDDRLLDLWMDYTAEQASTLLSAPRGAVAAIVLDAAALTPSPRPAKRVAVRRLAKNLSARKGWASLVMRLEDAWVAEFFSARFETDKHDLRSDDEAERERAERAAGWLPAVELALAFPGAPFGPSVRDADDVAAWLGRAFKLTQQQATAELPASARRAA